MQSELFDSAFKFSGIGFALVSTEGKWLKVNESLVNMLGYSEAELLNMDFIQITHPEDLLRDLSNVKDLLCKKRDSYQIEKRYFHKNGSTVHILLSVSLVRDQNDQPNYFVSQIQDVTQLKEAQQKLQNNAKLVALGEMAAGIAHEINNPLAIISLHAKALESVIKDPVIDREMLENFTYKITGTVDRISGIVSSLWKFSGDNSLSENFELVLMSDIVKDALGLCTEKFKAAGVSLNLSCPADLEVECNPLDISQILINLMNNAFYAIQNQEEKTISISIHKVGAQAVISVMDSGPGIPKHIRSKLLEPFFTTKPLGVGTGLGLSISRNTVRSHDGDLYLDETSEKTNFVVKLPLSHGGDKQSTLSAKLKERVNANRTL